MRLYVSGSTKAMQNTETARSLIKLLGIEPQRLCLEWISAAEGARFAELVQELTDQIRELGASPLSQAHNGKIWEGASIS
jgi:F420-non-reducing hydrogenase iron-sulfur subunit